MRTHRFLLDPPGRPLETGETLPLPSGESSHASRVLRLGPGDQVRAFDGSGSEFLAELLAPASEGAPLRVRLLEEAEPAGESPLDLTLALALVKKEALDSVLAKAVELGANRVALFPSSRSVARLDDSRKAAKKLDRWRSKLADAAKQCERARLPEVETLANLKALAKALAERGTEVFFLAERSEGVPGLVSALAEERKNQPRPAAVVVGPEGGWTDEEIDFARDAGWALASLGPRVLRAETAAVVAVALAQSVLGDLDAPR